MEHVDVHWKKSKPGRGRSMPRGLKGRAGRGLFPVGGKAERGAVSGGGVRGTAGTQIR